MANPFRGLFKKGGVASFAAQLQEFRLGLDFAILRIGSGMPDVWEDIAQDMYDQSAPLAPDNTAAGLTPRHGPNLAVLDVGGEEPPRSRAMFFGASRKFGWYAAPQFEGSAGKQFPEYVGSEWAPGGTTGIPHFIGPGLNRAADRAETKYGDAIENACIGAFPIGV